MHLLCPPREKSPCQSFRNGEAAVRLRWGKNYFSLSPSSSSNYNIERGERRREREAPSPHANFIRDCGFGKEGRKEEGLMYGRRPPLILRHSGEGNATDRSIAVPGRRNIFPGVFPAAIPGSPPLSSRQADPIRHACTPP